MANKITYATKVGLVPKATHSNQWWDDDANEVKTKHNLNDDRITALEAEVGTDTFDVLTLTPQDPNPAHSEGDLFYDGVKKALSVYNEVADITLNLGLVRLLTVKGVSSFRMPNLYLPFGILVSPFTFTALYPSSITKHKGYSFSKVRMPKELFLPIFWRSLNISIIPIQLLMLLKE